MHAETRLSLGTNRMGFCALLVTAVKASLGLGLASETGAPDSSYARAACDIPARIVSRLNARGGQYGTSV